MTGQILTSVIAGLRLATLRAAAKNTSFNEGRMRRVASSVAAIVVSYTVVMPAAHTLAGKAYGLAAAECITDGTAASIRVTGYTGYLYRVPTELCISFNCPFSSRQGRAWACP